MSYVLGVDLGTTYTAAAVHDADGASMVSLAHDRVAIPSVAALGAEGLLFGDAALTAAATDPTRAAREFKRRFGDTTPLFLAGTPFAADLLTARLLAWVVRIVAEQRGGMPTRTVVTHPANWGGFKLDLLEQAADVAAVGPVQLLPEPVAAAIHYDQRQRIADASSVAVYDFGGGTFDAAVVRRTGDHFELLGSPAGIEHLGGSDLDEVLLRLVQEFDRKAFARLDPEDEHAVRAMLRLREECTRAKVALSFDTRATIPVVLPDLVGEVLVQRSEFEQRIRPLVAETVTNLADAIASAGLRTDDLAAVLLVGGSSRVPLVAQMVSAELARPVVVDTHPKHAVALGAALHAAGATALPPVLPTEQMPAIADAGASADVVEHQELPNATVDISAIRRSLAAPVLVVVAGPAAGRTVALPDGRTTIGRGTETSGVVGIGDPLVSRSHLFLDRSADEVVVTDAGSTNGTRLDGRPLTAPARLLPGAVVEIGTSLLMLDVSGAEEPPPPSVLARTIRVPAPPAGGLLGGILRRRGRLQQWRAETETVIAELRARHARSAAARRLQDPPAALVLRWAEGRPGRLGRRTAGDADAGVVCLGLAPLPSVVTAGAGVTGELYSAIAAEAPDLAQALAAMATDADVPVTVDLLPGRRLVALTPPAVGDEVLRALLVQLLAQHHASCFSVVLVGGEPGELGADDVPADLPGGVPAVHQRNAAVGAACLDRHDLVVVVRAAGLSGEDRSMLAARIGQGVIAGCVWVGGPEGPVPAADARLVHDLERGVAELAVPGRVVPGVVLATLRGRA